MLKIPFTFAFAVSSCIFTQQQKTVSYADIGNKVQILGRFGLPLGTYLTLDGTRFGLAKGPTKVGGGNFRIERVNSEPLSAPMEMWVDKIKGFATDTPCRVEGYETGEMIGVPDEVLRRSGGFQPQAGWQFHVDFVTVGVSQR